MGELLLPALGALARWLITIAAAHGFEIAQDDMTRAGTALVAIGTIVWSIWQKHEANKK